MYKSIEVYIKLLDNINSYELRLLDRYGNHISCSEGCDSCCILETIFSVEAYYIFDSIKSNKTEWHYKSHMERERCVFINSGLCSIYKSRPVICRTHGYPVFIEGRTDFCPENFKDIDTLESEYILNLENLNNILASINIMFLKETNISFFKRDRITLKELADFIINNA